MAGSKLENNKSDCEAVVDLASTKKKIKMKKETQKKYRAYTNLQTLILTCTL